MPKESGKKVTDKQMGNLKPFDKLTEKERREIARKGGKASVEARKEKKLLKDSLLAILETDEGQEKICTALVQQARRGNIKAFEVIRDTIGQKPIEKSEVTGANGGPIQYEDMTDDEIDKRLAEIETILKR